MFTGIVEERARVGSVGPGPSGTRLVVECRTVAEDAAVGASVSVNGVCLTVADRDEHSLGFDLSPETLDRSTLGSLSPGDPVNLERPVTLATRLGGHLVQGHVDGVGTVEAVDGNGQGTTMRIRAPEAVARYLVDKGSVAVDGVSLTVAGMRDGAFEVALIPHTLEVTTLGDRRAGEQVNLEADVVAKYVERMTRRKP